MTDITNTTDRTYTAITALVPVKTLNTVKSRLAHYLSVAERETLVLDMLHHVLHVLLSGKLLERVSVVSPDERVLRQAQLWGAHAIREEQPGHNAALHSAALLEERDGGLLTISADLPLLHTEDIRMLIEQSIHYPVVLAASHDGTGTNALLVRPPLAIPYLFGPNSLQRYQQAAKNTQLASTVCQRIGLALDVDTIDDLNLWQMLQHVNKDERKNSYGIIGKSTCLFE